MLATTAATFVVAVNRVDVVELVVDLVDVDLDGGLVDVDLDVDVDLVDVDLDVDLVDVDLDVDPEICSVWYRKHALVMIF